MLKELEKASMKKSKILYLFNFIILVLTIIYSFNYNYVSKYKDESEIIGAITKITKKNNNVQIILNAKEKILVTCYECDFNYKVGDIVKFVGAFKEVKNSTNFNLFDYKKYLMSLKIHKNFVFKEAIYIKNSGNIIYNSYNFFNDKISNLKSSYFLKAMILGNTNDFSESDYESYKKNGIVHLFAISGMHVGIISSLLILLLNKVLKLKNFSYLLIFPILIIYMLIINSASIIRSVLMFISSSLVKIFKLKISSINILYYLVIINIFINPYVIYNMGFLLSYVISFFLILSSKKLNKINNYFTKMFYLSLISFLASLPIIINSNFEFNLLTPLINVFIVPFVSIILFPLSLLTLFIPTLDVILSFLLTGFNNLNIILSNNGLIVNVPYLSVYLIVLYYIFYIIFIFKTKYLYFLTSFILFLIILKYINFNSYVVMLDVGQGDSIVIKNYYGKNILIDAGSKENSAGTIIIPYLKSVGITKIDEMIISHGDSDHIAAAISIVNNLRVGNVIFNCGTYNDLEKELIKVLDKKNVPYCSCINELNIDNNKIYFLQTKKYDNENDNSNVIYMDINNYKFMFMGDASSVTEKEIMNKYNLSDIDVLKVGHHGSKTSSSIEFINEINPQYSIISVGKNNRYGHPNKEVLENLDHSKIYRTDQDGSIMFKIKNNKLNIETCSP